jgi:hypothetical protein
LRKPGSAPRRSVRRASLGAAAVTLCGALGYALAVGAGGPAAAARQTASRLYPALASSGPTGITFATPAQVAAGSPGTNGPVWTKEPGAAGSGGPLAETIRRLPATGAAVTTWVAESAAGGVCVLISPTQAIGGGYPVGAVCGEPGAVEAGVAGTFVYPGGNRFALAGVAPSGVSSVSVALADGSTVDTAVRSGGWAVGATSAPVGYTPEPGGTTVTIGGE